MKVTTAKRQGKVISKSSIHLLFSICMIILIAGTCSIFVINWRMKMHAREEAREKAMMMLDRNLAIHSYFSHQLKPVLFKKMESLVKDDYFEPVWMSSTYAVRGIDRYYRSIAKRDYYYKECAINARSPANEADAFERAFIEKLNKTSGLNEQATVRTINARPYFVVLRRGESMEQSCLRCHSTPEAAPADLVMHYGPERSFARIAGEVVSAVSIRVPLDVAYANVNRLIFHLSALLGMTLLVAFSLAAYLSKRWVFNPLNTIRRNAMKISEDPKLLGEQMALPSSYELSELAKAFNAMSSQLRRERDRLEYRVEERTKDLKHARDTLQESEKRYRLLFENMSEGFALHEIITDADGKASDYRFLEINPAFERLTGLSRETAVGKTVREVIPDIENSWIETYGRVALEGNPVHIENYSAPLNRWYEVFAYRPAPGQFAVVFTDITERKLAERVLQQNEERLKRSQEIAHLGSWELDLGKDELTWSDEVYRIFGLQPQQFGATYDAFLASVHPDDRQMVDEAYSDSLHANRDNYEIEHRVVRPDGTIRYVHEKCEHHRDGSGKIIRSVGMVHDITEQRQAQEALKRSNQELEQFAYVASHDLQEPLRAIVGFLQLLQGRYANQIDETGRHFIERSVKAGHRMQTLIRELLTLSRVTTKGARFASTDLNPLVKDVLESLQPIIQEKNADICCAGLPNLTIDAGQIQSLFQNLIVNAVRYNESPKPVIEIGCRELDDVYHFFVKDNGIGISPKYYQRIFMVFQRLHTDREYPGTGLGLALCKKIVERHGGTIWVESQPKGGSTFYFTLPKKRWVL
jgi:PAS domain S-box-containing protein